MQTTLRMQPQPTLTTRMLAKVAGMGQVSEVELTETRVYGGEDGLLSRIDFAQRAATGEVRVSGVRQGAVLRLDVAAGGVSHAQEVACSERLADAVRNVQLARRGKPGATASGVHFDPSIQKQTRVTYRVVAAEQRFFAGLAAAAVQVRADYPDLGMHETAWIGSDGRIWESRIGGMFVARLEPPEVARNLDFSQDMLLGAVVRAPQPLRAPQSLRRVTLRLSGFGSALPPASPRQQVQSQGRSVQLTLSRDAPPSPARLGAPIADGAPDAAAARLALLPTPFIQSDAPAIVAAARAAVAGETDAFAASSKLAAFVHQHIHSEYVPAYSNALEALQSARGDCTEHSVLFVALARAVALPARVAVGLAYWPPGNGFGWHAWAEVYIDGRWLTVDPTWDQPLADATHIKLADGGPAEQARIVMLLGELKILDMAAQ